MDLNADFAARAVVHAADIAWVASPMKGVDRRMLDRIGAEVARADHRALCGRVGIFAACAYRRRGISCAIGHIPRRTWRFPSRVLRAQPAEVVAYPALGRRRGHHG